MINQMSYMLYPQIAYNKIIASDERQRMIFAEVCNYFNVPIKSVFSKNRKHNVCICRNTIAYILRFDSKMSWRQIGGVLGNKHHTSAMHSVKAIKNWMETDEKILSSVMEIRMKILAQLPLNLKQKNNGSTFLRERDLVGLKSSNKTTEYAKAQQSNRPSNPVAHLFI